MLTLLVLATGLVGDVTRPFCDRGAPEPLSFHARGFGYVAEIFPPKSRHNKGSRPLVFMYSVAYPGSEWRVNAKRLWMAELPNAQMAQAALVSMTGHVVTLDDYYQSGGEHSLVIFDAGGRFVRSFTLEQLLGQAELARVTFSDCGRLWREGTKFYFSDGSDTKLYVVFPWGRAPELTIATGTLRRGTVTDFPPLQEINSRTSPNEQVESWSISLRFSSLTDIVARPP